MIKEKPWFQLLICPVIGLLVALSITIILLLWADASSHDDAPARGTFAYATFVLAPEFVYLLISNFTIWILLRAQVIKGTITPHVISFVVIAIPFIFLMGIGLVGAFDNIFYGIMGAVLLVVIMLSMYLPNLYFGKVSSLTAGQKCQM